MPKMRNGNGEAAQVPGQVDENETERTTRLTNMVSETTCLLNGVLAAVIGLRECPTDQLFGGVIQLIEDLVAHAQRTEEAAYEQSRLAQTDRE